MDKKQKLLEIDKKIAKVSILSFPAPLLLGFGLLGKFAAPDELPFAFLNDSTTVNLMLAVGAVAMVWTSYLIFKLAMEKAKAQSETN